MDISNPPSANELQAASGIWKWLLFFAGLIGAGGAIEYWLNKRYVTRKELEGIHDSCVIKQQTCKQHVMDQIEIALLKNNERLEEKMINAVSVALERVVKK